MAKPKDEKEKTPSWHPPEGHIVSDEKSYHITVGGVRYVHVDDAPDGRWIYRQD